MNEDLKFFFKEVFIGLQLGIFFYILAYIDFIDENASGFIFFFIGSIILLLSTWFGYSAVKEKNKKENWLKKHKGKLLFFFPTKKRIQNSIQEKILPLFNKKPLITIYNGPYLVGDLVGVYYLFRTTMRKNRQIRPNYPIILQINMTGVFDLLGELPELMNIESKDFDWEAIKKKIKDIEEVNRLNQAQNINEDS